MRERLSKYWCFSWNRCPIVDDQFFKKIISIKFSENKYIDVSQDRYVQNNYLIRFLLKKNQWWYVASRLAYKYSDGIIRSPAWIFGGSENIEAETIKKEFRDA